MAQRLHLSLPASDASSQGEPRGRGGGESLSAVTAKQRMNKRAFSLSSSPLGCGKMSSAPSRSAVCCVLICTLMLSAAAKPSAEVSIETHPKDFMAGRPAARGKGFDSLQADDYSDISEQVNVNRTERREYMTSDPVPRAALPVSELEPSVCIRRCSEACSLKPSQWQLQPQPSTACKPDDSHNGILTPLRQRDAIGGSMFAIAILIVVALIVRCRRK